MKIFTSSHFERRYGKLSQFIKEKAKIREKIFMHNPFDPRLGTHKLHGKYGEEWAYSIDYDYRIKFVFLENGDVFYTDAGAHNEVYK